MYRTSRSWWQVGAASAALWCVLWWCGGSAVAQDQADDVRASATIALAGVRSVRPQVWTVGRANVRNPFTHDLNLLVTMSFDDLPAVQFTTPVWLPPLSRREVLVPMKAPDFKDDRSVNTKVQLLDESRQPPHVARENGVFAVEMDRPTTAVVRDSEDIYCNEAATALRLASRLERGMSSIPHNDLPHVFIGYEGLDNLVFTKDFPASDAAQVKALRQWIMSGGRIWVAGEQVDSLFMRRLLGNDWTFRIIDIMHMNRLQIMRAGNDEVLHEVEVERPVEMARLYAPGWQVIHEVRNWPASLYKQIGLGGVMVTTLSARAWYGYEWVEKAPRRRRTNMNDGGEQLPPPPPQIVRREKASPAMMDLRAYFNVQFADPPVPQAQLAQYATNEIGYETLKRGPVAMVLGLFIIGVLGCGLFFLRNQRLEHTSWVAVILALVASGALLGLGSLFRADVPLTVSEANLVRVIPQQGYAVTDGALAVYSPISDQGPLRGTKGGAVWPDLTAQKGELVRVKRDDLGRWEWDGVKLPQNAILSARTRHIALLPQRTFVRVTFNQMGAVGQAEAGAFEHFEDAVIAGPNGFAAPKVTAGDRTTIAVTPDDELPSGQYMAGGALTSTQQRRAALYRVIFDGIEPAEDDKKSKQQPVAPLRVTEPVLFAWSDPLDLGYTLPKKQLHDKKQATLLMVPLEFEPAEAGQRVTVPAMFLPYRPVRDAAGKGSTTVYNPRTGEWISSVSSSTVVLSFALPSAVLPLKVTGGKLTLDIDAPRRSLEVFCYHGDQRVTIETEENVVGRQLSIDFDEHAEGMTVDETGHVLVGFHLGKSAVKSTSWQVNDVRLQLTGDVGGE